MIKVTENKIEEDGRVYPWIGENLITKTIILFNTYSCGSVLAQKEGLWKEGRYFTAWNMNNFKNYTGTLTLENK